LKLNRNALTPEASVFLNIIRVIAAEVVVISHFFTKYQPMFLNSIFFGGMLGGLGVFTFFAISGFLIAYTILRKTENSTYRFRDFFVDRFSRIYSGLIPAVLVSLMLAVGIYCTNQVYFNHLLTSESQLSISEFAATLTMTNMVPNGFFNAVSNLFLGSPLNFTAISSFGFNSVLWSLMVEWWIYMFFGWVVLGSLAIFGRKNSTSGFKTLFLSVTAILSVVIVALAWNYGAFIFVWFLGAAALYAVTNSTVTAKLNGHRAQRILIYLFLITLAAVGFEAYKIYTLTHESFNILFGSLIACCIFLSLFIVNSKTLPKLSKLLLTKRAVKISASMASFSYTLFLIHYPILLFINGLNFSVDRVLLFLPIMLVINEIAFLLASVTEKKHKDLAVKIKQMVHIT
jgi:peptidoglycan/LPS O-acetylase OafA/YrhL